MTVLQKGDLDRKEFSLALPAITNQLNFLVDSIHNSAFNNTYLEREALHGLAYILEDIRSDLEKINDALYPAEAPDSQGEPQGKAA
jgi:hypothetical protein